RCGTPWNTETRQDAMLNRLKDHLMPAADRARTLTIYGHPTKANTIRQRRRRQHLTAADVNDDGQPLNRLGDALQHSKKDPACTPNGKCQHRRKVNSPPHVEHPTKPTSSTSA